MEHGWLIGLALIGIVISLYILRSKTQNKQMVCLPGQNCTAVVNSKYGKTFGIENTYLGLTYYGFIVAIGITEFFSPEFVALTLVSLTKIISSGMAVLFSAYLTYAQAFILKDWCHWCISSGIINLSIFLIIIF